MGRQGKARNTKAKRTKAPQRQLAVAVERLNRAFGELEKFTGRGGVLEGLSAPSEKGTGKGNA